MQLEDVDKETTVLLMSVSPLEIHGPHLPLGADVIISEELLNRYAQAIAHKLPHLSCLKLPPLYMGADPLTALGSIGISARVLERSLMDYVKGLKAQGFKYLLIADNHGGPRHQMAMEAAARKAFGTYGFYLLVPFNMEFRLMVQHDADFLAKTGLAPGCCGDDEDSHAGTNETSLMLAARPQLVDEVYRTLPLRTANPSVTGKLIQALAKILATVGIRRLSDDLIHLSKIIDWISMEDMPTYLGAPAKASREAGEAMFKARVDIGMDLLDKALQGEKIDHRPMLWGLRLLRVFN